MNTESNAMTEVALALAMAFFAIFVLAAVSMGLPDQGQANRGVEPLEMSTGGQGKRNILQNETFIVYIRGAFYNEALEVLNREQFEASNKIILAVRPTLSLTEILDIKQNLAAKDVSLVPLNGAWLARISKMPGLAGGG